MKNKSKNQIRRKYNLDNLINKRNQVDWELFDKIQLEFFSKNAKYNLKNRPEKHSGEATTWEHIQNVVKSAKKIFLPLGVSRRILIFTSLLHDIGKPFRKEDHGLDSAKCMDRIFSKSEDYNLIRLAVRYHMLSTNISKKHYKKIILEAQEDKVNPKKLIKLILVLNKVDIIRNRKLTEIDELSGKTIRKTISKETKTQKKLFKEALKELKI